jgi:hypothetical protein
VFFCFACVLFRFCSSSLHLPAICLSPALCSSTLCFYLTPNHFRPSYIFLTASLSLFPHPHSPNIPQSGAVTCLTLFRHRDPHPRGAATTAGAFRAFDFDAPPSPFDHYAQPAAQRSAAAVATSDGLGNSSSGSGQVSRGAGGASGSAGAVTAATATDLVRQIVRALRIFVSVSIFLSVIARIFVGSCCFVFLMFRLQFNRV